MELRHLRYLVAVADVGTISGAARRLFVSQQAVSRQLRDLEREVGVPLLERARDGVRLTPAGAALVRIGRGATQSLDELVASLRASSYAQPITLALGSVDHGIRLGVVTETLRAMQCAATDHDYPADERIEVTAHQLGSLAQWSGLRDRQLDLGIVSTVPPAEQKDLGRMRLLRDPLAAAYVPKGAFSGSEAAGDAPLTIAKLSSLPLVEMPRAFNPRFHERLDAALANAGQSHAPRRQATGSRAAWSMVAAGLGWALVPRSYAQSAMKTPDGVEVRLIEDFSLSFSLYMIWRAGDLRPALECLRRAVLHAVAQHTSAPARSPL
jgi:DNA-binding transcriptional LysR family regulator